MGPPPGANLEAQNRLQQMLAGRAAGQPISCLPPGRSSNDMTSLGNGTVVFRSGNTLYVNEMRGTCANLRSHYALVTRQFGSGLCSGEIAEVIDPTTGISVSSCSFGEFVPYRRAGG